MKQANNKQNLNVWTKRTHTGLSASCINLVFKHIVTRNISEMLWEY